MPIKFNKKAASSHKVTKQKRRVAKKRAGVAKVVRMLPPLAAIFHASFMRRNTRLQSKPCRGPHELVNVLASSACKPPSRTKWPLTRLHPNGPSSSTMPPQKMPWWSSTHLWHTAMQQRPAHTTWCRRCWTSTRPCPSVASHSPTSTLFSRVRRNSFFHRPSY